jgi:hypothetical protein
VNHYEVEEGPGRGYFALGGAVLVAGCVYFGVFLWQNISRIGENLTQVVVPGKSQLALSEPGKYTIFYEYQSVVGNKVYSTRQDLSGLKCSLVSKDTGTGIALSPSTLNSRYSLGSRSGVSVFDFQIERPGTYELSAEYSRDQEGPEVVLAVGRGFAEGIFRTVAQGLGILFGSIALGVGIIVVTLVKRDKARKRATDRYA